MKVYFFYFECDGNDRIVDEIFASKELAIDARIKEGKWNRDKYKSEEEFRKYIFDRFIYEAEVISE